MKYFQQSYLQMLKGMLGAMLLIGMLLPWGVKAASVSSPLDLATVPLANSPTITIQPNLLFVLDDSGSMAWDFMPDYVDDNSAYKSPPLYDNSAFNTVTYNPAIRYLPPAFFDAGGLNTTQYPSQTGTSADTGANTSFGFPNWRRVKRDAYLYVTGINTTRDDLTNNALYFHTVAGEYCSEPDLKTCVTQDAPSDTHPFAAPVRWCNTGTNAGLLSPPANSCQRVKKSGFANVRYPSARVSTITVSGSGGGSSTNTSVSSITVGGVEILSGTTNASSTNSTIAARIAENINNCTYAAIGNCGTSGFYATVSSSTVTLYASATTSLANISSTPSISKSGTRTVSATAFSKNNVPGKTIPVAITDGGSYPLPGTSSKAGERTDCAGTTCTYAEEMTNYANWYTYYRTRMQTMKTAASLAFRDVGEDFKVGLMTINTTSGKSLNIATFNTAQKAAWYSKFFSIYPSGSTPLRGALAKAGRIYAKQEDVGGVFTDPIEYSCQQNFTLLTSDGFWNGPNSLVIDVNGNAIGNLDGSGTPRPKYEGGTATSRTLADTAKYYRETDLRTGALDNCIGALGESGGSVCQDAPPSEANQKQTMVTFTLGMGVDGELVYATDYKTATSGDFHKIKTGSLDWPVPSSGSAKNIDDMWHAAVNGDGTYFSASNPTELSSSLKEALASIEVKLGAGAAAATSTLNPVSTDNDAFVASYTTGHWTGNLEKRSIDPVSGAVSSTTEPGNCVEDVVVSTSCDAPSSIEADGEGGYDCVTPEVTVVTDCVGGTWDGVANTCSVPVAASCIGSLKNKVLPFEDLRTIYMNSGSGLVKFTYSNLSASQKTTFEPAFLAANLTQWTLLTPAQQALVTGESLVNYLRGQTGLDENAADPANRVFRKRQAVLGDVINAKPAFIGKPTFSYVDYGYDSFKSTKATRAGMVYVASNDGMLHAFNAATLEEVWAYVPSMVIPNMWKLADTAYDTKHSYYVDGDPVISDICVSGCGGAGATWKTILVGGLNAGGRGYYALDITDPATPSLLWEFDATVEPNLGYTFGTPVVTKDPDGKWIVLVTSGYNNIPDDSAFYDDEGVKFKPNNPPQFMTGDGKGYLYILDAVSGSKLTEISTGVGTPSLPSGLGKITAYADDAERNNTAEYVYGGDLLGNLWRFDLSDNSVMRLAQMGSSQPITVKPEIGLIKKKRVIFVGTGKYLEVTDLTNTDQQTLYAIKDEGVEVDLSGLVPQTMEIDGEVRKVTSNNAVNWDSSSGWYINFPESAERQHVASRLILGTLLVPTTVPTSSACQPAGHGWFTFLDYRTGRSVLVDNVVSTITSSPVVGFNVVYIDGKPKVSIVTADNPTPKLIPDVPFSGSGSGFTRTRSIWRELITD